MPKPATITATTKGKDNIKITDKISNSINYIKGRIAKN